MKPDFVNNLYLKLKHELQEFHNSSYLSEDDLKNCIALCDAYISQLRSYISCNGFDSIDEEIYFFKELKPRFMHRHYYYVYVMRTEMNMPLQDPAEIIPYLENRKKEIHAFHKSNLHFSNYLRLNRTELDQVYFSRKSKFQWECDLHYQNRDPLFYSPKDDVLAQLKANKAILLFLDNKIKFMQGAFLPFESSLKWTGSKVSLVELSYGIWCTKSCEADILTISKALGTLFNVDTEDCHRIFTDIKSRKIDKTKFIRQMDKSLLMYIENYD